MVEEDEKTGDMVLRDLSFLRNYLLHEEKLSVERVALRVIAKLRKWVDIFSDPKLYPLHFPDEDNHEEESENQHEEKEEAKEMAQAEIAAVHTLHNARGRLMESVDDPLPEVLKESVKAATLPRLSARLAADRDRDARAAKGSVEKAAKAPDPDSAHEKETPVKKPALKNSSSKKRKRQGGDLLDKKPSATSINFDDDDASIPDPPNDSMISDLPNRAINVKEGSPERKFRTSQQKSYDGRRIWTDEEKHAIKQGMRSYGIGKWAEIKSMYSTILKDRTSGQIKDCYRTMNKRGELSNIVDV